MVAAITPYLAWMRTTGAQAEETANQARAAAFAYEAAFAETVPPPVVTANRTLQATLVATNILGQNTPAIATTDAEYAEMWARDTGAMFAYAGSTASATRLTPFTQPDQTTTSDAGQSESVAQATATAAGNTRNAVTQQPFSAVPNLLSSAAVNPAAAADPSALDGLDLGADLITYFLDAPAALAGLFVDSPSASIALPFDIAGALTGFHTDDIISGWAGVQSWPGTGAVPPTPFPVITNPAGGFGTLASAGLGQANTVGGLSVPPGWAAAAPAIRPAAVVLPATSAGAGAEAAAAAAAPTGSGSLFGEMAVASMAGRAMAGTGGALGRERARPGEIENATREAPKEPTKEPSTPPQVAAGGPITSIAAELRELASLRDAGILTQQEFEEQKKRLLPS
jgi:PPE-repeat protein